MVILCCVQILAVEHGWQSRSKLVGAWSICEVDGGSSVTAPKGAYLQLRKYKETCIQQYGYTTISRYGDAR